MKATFSWLSAKSVNALQLRGLDVPWSLQDSSLSSAVFQLK